ncbi:MAG TPA: M20/M25/M40 family metallo-hydrolase, partial [Longimicrobiales bacterium]|nr:M20/M25/M40 family metallo-hydrolase [Longimicrobiales bacterium]
MSDYRIPDLPSDEELGIAGLSEEDLAEPAAAGPAKGGGKTPPPPGAAPSGGAPTPAGHRPLPWRGLITLAVLLAGIWLSSSYRVLPSPQAANAPDTAFASGRALTLLVEVARRPHPTGSPDHDRVRDLLVSRLRELGLEPEVQEVTQVTARRDRARAATVRNIVARIPGTASTGAILLTAHYDAVPGSPGAGDDATGVAAIVETVRALGAGDPLRNDVIILISDAEELGLFGARAFVERHPWMAQVEVVLSVEMRGAGGPSIMFETGAENGWIVERLQEADPRPLANSVSTEIYRRLPNDTDFSPFRDAGVQGLNFAAIGRADRYHQPTDTPENLQESTLQHHGERLLALVRHLGDVELAEVRARDRAFTVLPFVGMVSLSVGLALPITLSLLLLLLVVTFLASLRGTRSRGFLLAAVLSGVAVGLSAGAGWALLRWFLPLLPLYGTGALVPAVHGEGVYFVALAATALGITSAVFSLGHRWMTPLEATLGALLIPVLALLAATLMAPAAAINLQGPLASTLLLLLLLTGVGLHRARGTVAWIASLILALPVLAFVVPVQELVAVALTLRAAPLIGGLMALALLFILPALSAL